METGQKGADNSELVSSGIRKMDTSGLPLPILQAADLQNCQAFSDQGTSLSYVFPTIPISINASIPLLTEGVKTLQTVKEERGLKPSDISTTQSIQDLINSGLAIPFTKMSDSNFTQNSEGSKEGKNFERSDLQAVGSNLPDDKISPLNILVVSYPDAGQQSPSVSQAGAQGLRFQSAGGAGDAMLSAINYNDSDMLQDSAFDMNTANAASNLPHLDEGILGSMGNPAQNIRLPEGHTSHSFDLFDSNVHDSLSLSPQPFSDPGFSVTDTSNISATTGDSEGSGERRQSVESPTDGATKAKSKSRQPKTQMSPSKTVIQCPTCKKAFNNSSALAKHRLTHSDERKYVCSVCQKGFKRQDHLNGHMMTHREKKPYQCQMEGCEKSYCDARSLRRHLEANHHQSPEAIASSVLASMAAAGIPTTNHTGKPRSAAAEKLAAQETSRMQVASPTYSANTTPSPSPSYTSPNPQGQIFQFEAQPGLPTTVVSSQQATPPQDQSWQDRARVYDFVGNPGSSQASPHSGEQSPVYAAQVSPVTPVSPVPHNQPTSPLTGQQRPAWFSTPPVAPENKNTGDETKPPVQCSICQRRFKNIPALNGHMRLHGGYLKKSKEEKKAAKKTEMGPPPPPSPRQPVAAVSVASPAQLQVQMNPVLPNISQAFQTLSTAGEASTSQSMQQAGGLTAVTVHQEQISQDSQLLRQQQQQLIHQQLQLHPTSLEEHANNSIEEQIKTLQAFQQQQQQQQQQDQLTAQEQVSSPHAHQAAQQAAQQIQQLVQSVQAEQLPQLTVQQLEQLQQHQTQIQVQQPIGQIHQLPQLSAQQLEQLQQQHLQLGLPAQIQPSQLHQLVQEHHLHQLQQQAQQGSQPEVITTSSQPLSSSHQFIQLSAQQQQQLQQLAEITHIPVQEILEDTKDSAAEKQQQIQRIQQHLASVDQQPAQTSSQQNPFPQNVEFTSSGDVQIAQHPPQDLPQQISLDIGSRDLPPNLELQLQHQLLPLQSPPITLNSVAIQSSLQTALSLAQMPQLEQRQVLSNSGQTQFVNASQLTTGPVSLSPVTDNQEVTVAQLLNSMANFQEGLLLQPTSQTQTGIPTEISVLQSQPSVTLSQENYIQSAFNPLHTISQPVSIQSITTPQQMLDSITSPPQLQSQKSEHLSMNIHGHLSGAGNLAPKLKTDFIPVKEQNSELKRRLSADLERSSSPKKFITSQNSLAMLLTKEAGIGDDRSFAKPVLSMSKDTDAVSRVRIRSKSGDDHKLKRSKSVDHTFMRPRSRTESETLYRPKSRVDDTIVGRAKSHPDEMLSRSDGAGVFRNPMSASPMKVKRKHRPAPLFIPLHLNSFQSRLRSPRLWDGGDGRPRGSTPPPYTPPPMLSPIRSGSGLFWTLQSNKPITPRSAPITPKLSMGNKRASLGQKPEPILEAPEEEEQEEPPPETDIQPHVNVGTQYQAELPQFNPHRSNAALIENQEDIVWEPSGMGENTDDEVQYYQEFACSAAVKGNGSNVEYALHLLYLCKGSVQDAMLMLMDDPPKLPKKHGLLAYKYQESDTWTSQEIEAFHQALLRFSKDFFAVSNEVKTKNTKQCIQFYYLWKKVCPEDYKKLRVLRRKREQEALYNLRSRPPGEDPQPQQQQQQMPQEESDSEDSVSAHSGEPNEIKSDLESSSMSSSPAPSYSCDYPECHAVFTSKQALNGHTRMHGGGPVRSVYVDTTIERPPPPPPPPRPPPPPPPPVQRKPRPATPSKPPQPPPDGTGDIFPCKLCSRVFYKVKSRSAHMKSHKVQDNEKNKARELEQMSMKPAVL